MTTAISCIYAGGELVHPENKYTLVAYCHQDYVSDFRVDLGFAVALLTGISEIVPGGRDYEIVVENVSVVAHEELSEVRACLHAQAAMATQHAVESIASPVDFSAYSQRYTVERVVRSGATVSALLPKKRARVEGNREDRPSTAHWSCVGMQQSNSIWQMKRCVIKLRRRGVCCRALYRLRLRWKNSAGDLAAGSSAASSLVYAVSRSLIC